MKITKTLTGRISFSSNWLGRQILMVEEKQTMYFKADVDAPDEEIREITSFRAATKRDMPFVENLLCDTKEV